MSAEMKPTLRDDELRAQPLAHREYGSKLGPITALAPLDLR
jgi:hypothetical protein